MGASPARPARVLALALALALASGCAEARQVPPDPWTGSSHAHFVELRGMGLGTPPWHQGPLRSVEDDHTPYPDTGEALENARDFAFVLRQGSAFLQRQDVLEIDAEGRATLTFGKPSRRATFRLSAKELERLKMTLVLVDVFRLEKSYSAGAEDGGAWSLDVTASGWKKRVACDNHFPAALVLVSELVRKEILARHSAEIEGAPLVDPQR